MHPPATALALAAGLRELRAQLQRQASPPPSCQEVTIFRNKSPSVTARSPCKIPPKRSAPAPPPQAARERQGRRDTGVSRNSAQSPRAR